MAKFGYKCKCGWRLERGSKTRRQYALAKEEHAAICRKLWDELAVTKRAELTVAPAVQS